MPLPNTPLETDMTENTTGRALSRRTLLHASLAGGIAAGMPLLVAGRALAQQRGPVDGGVYTSANIRPRPIAVVDGEGQIDYR